MRFDARDGDAGVPSSPDPGPGAPGSAYERILDAVVDLAGAIGYQALTVEKILEAAGLSRATFYQYFSSVDDSFWSAYRMHAQRVALDALEAREGSGPGVAVVLGVLIREALVHPAAAQLLFGECLAATPTGLLERDALIARLEHAAARNRRGGDGGALPERILIGGAFRFLVMWLEDRTLTPDPSGELRRWTEVFAGHRAGPALYSSLPGDAQRPPIPVSRQGSPRERIIRAATAAAYGQGVRAVRVADIATAAGVSQRSFYNEFSSKTDAVTAAYEDAFRRALEASTPAFFSANGWPERVWASALAFSSFLAREPATCYLGLVECHALGRDFSARVHATQRAFTLFLQEGAQQPGRAPGVSPARSALCALTIAEIGFHAARAGHGLPIRRLTPLCAYVALAPFLGVEPAAEFLAAKRL